MLGCQWQCARRSITVHDRSRKSMRVSESQRDFTRADGGGGHDRSARELIFHKRSRDLTKGFV